MSYGDSEFNNVVLFLPLDGIDGSTDIRDRSNTRKTVTAVANAAIKTTSYPSLSGKTSSAYFDGVGDWLSVAAHTDFSFGTSNFTIEGYFKLNTIYSDGNTLISTGRASSPFYSFRVSITTAGAIAAFVSTDSGVTANIVATSASGLVTAGIWYSFAVVRASTTLYLFLDGILVGINTSLGAGSVYYDTSTPFLIGVGLDYTNSEIQGWVSNIRYTKSARYTSNYTPSLLPIFAGLATTTDSSYSSILLLLNAEGSIIDTSKYQRVITVSGQAAISKVDNKTGISSIYFDGSGDYLDTPTSAEFNFGTGDFTIEAWIKPTNFSSAMDIVSKYTTYSTAVDFRWSIAITTGILTFYAGDSIPISIASNAGLTANVWTHVAVSRVSGVTRMFINGTAQTATHTGSVSIANNKTSLRIGANTETVASSFYLGFIDNLRITATGRYSTSFTSPNYHLYEEYYTSVSESLITSETYLPARRMLKELSESILATNTVTYKDFISIVETLLVDSVLNSKVTFKVTQSEAITLQNSISLLFNNVLTESIITSSVLSSLKDQIESILENILTTDFTSSKGVLLQSVVSAIHLLSYLDRALHASVTENLVVTNLLTPLYKLYNSIVETTILNNSTSTKYLTFKVLSDTLTVNNNLSSKGILRSLLEDEIIVTLPQVLGDDSYLAYLLSPETNSVSTYTNYNFNGCTPFKGKYLFYNRTGLYEYGGELDDTVKIRSELETVAFNFKSSNLKQVPSLYLGVNSTDNFILKVRVDGKAEVIYKLNKHTQNLQTQKIDIGKGLIGRYFQFELLTEASEFDLESIEFYPIELRRKL